jgi:hypothetical protein
MEIYIYKVISPYFIWTYILVHIQTIFRKIHKKSSSLSKIWKKKTKLKKIKNSEENQNYRKN